MNNARSLRRVLFLALALLAWTVPSVEASDAVPRLEPAPYAARLAETAEPLPVGTLMEASLVLSGVDPAYVSRGVEKLRAAARDVSKLAEEVEDQGALAEAILSYMHETMLRAYSEPVTEMDVLLERGVYNCVSSAVLFLILARSVDIEVFGIKTNDHAFCRVRTEEGSYDVETTNVHGFNPGEKKEFTDAFGRITGFTYVPPNRDSNRQDIGEKELLALILQNRASYDNDRRRFVAAVEASVDAYHLARTGDSAQRLSMILTNMASWYNSQSSFETGVAFLRQARAVYGPDSRLEKALSDMVHNRIVHHIEDGDLEGAREHADAHLRAGEIDRSHWKSFMVYIYQVEAQDLAARHGALRALRRIRDAVEALGADSRLAKSLSVYEHNYEVEAHNALVRAFRADDLEGAGRILEEALAVIPDSTLLKRDLRRVEQAQASR